MFHLSLGRYQYTLTNTDCMVWSKDQGLSTGVLT